MALQITGPEDAPTFVVPPRPGRIRSIWPPLLAGAVLLPLVLPRYWIFCVTVGLILAIACLGLLVLTGWAGEISLMQAGLTGSALYLGYYLYADRYPRGGGMWFPLAAAIAVSFAVLMSVLVALVSLRLAGAYVLTLIPQVFLDAKINVYLLGGVGLAVGVFLGPRGLAGAVSDRRGRRPDRGSPGRP